jgi:predicted ATP-dependent Lon-type protease
MSQQLDPVDTIAAKAFEGYVVRKDLVRKFKGQYPVPTYVAEFRLGRYCASVDERNRRGYEDCRTSAQRKDGPRWGA